ncbi:MAG: hypothetical protein AABY84_04090, partial [Candidatus Firestonebacteria bacterium]
MRNKLYFKGICISFFLAWTTVLFAGTRIKTVEYSFGSYYSATDIATATSWSPSSLTLYIPENTRTIKSAYLEFECNTIANTAVSNIDIMFDAGASASTVRDSITGTYTAITGECIKIIAKADVTSYLASDFVGTTSKLYSASVTVTGPGTNGHSLKLYITYEYGDTSTRQIKTVRFPLFSDVNIASKLAAVGAGTYSFTYNAEIADSNVVVRQQWFEIRGYRQSSGVATNSSISVKVQGAVTGSNTMTLRGVLIDSYDFRFLDHQGNTGIEGFAINTSQILDITRVQGNTNYLGGECVVTYEYDDSSLWKTKTVRYFLGQLINGGGGNMSQNIYLGESGIEILRMYSQIYGSFDSTTATNLLVDSSVNGYSVTQRGYSLQISAASISGYTFFHDLGEQKANFLNGSQIIVGVNNVTNAGGQGTELIITYKYSGESAGYTNDYRVITGQSANGTGTTSAQTFSVYFPSWYSPQDLGVRTLRSSWFRGDTIRNGATGDHTTTQNFNGLSSQTVTHRTAVESFADYVLYGNAGQITTSSANATANYSISVNTGSFSGVSGIVYTYAKPPNIPTNLAQYKSDGTTLISTGVWTNESTVVLKMTMTSPLSSDTLTPQIEILPIGTGFTGTQNYSGSFVAYSGSGVTGTVTVTGLTSGTQYHWQARVSGTNGVGPWQSYPTPTPNGEAEADLGIDTSNPGITDTQTGDDTWKNVSGTAYNVDFSDTGNSLLSYAQYTVYSNTNLTGTTLKDWTNIASSINASDYTNDWAVDWTSLQQGTNYVSVRVYDNAGNWATLVDPFYIKKDATNPGITDNQTGDDTWKNVSGTAYNIDFSDTGNSLLSYVQYTVYSGAGLTGSTLKDWTNIASSINANDYTNDWQVDWTALQQGTNYVSVRVYDNAGNSATLVDPFYVKKDTTNPVITDLQTGDDVWKNVSGTSYNIDFSDTGNSLLSYAQYTVYSNTNLTGTTLKDWTNIASSINASDYTTDWQVDWASLQQGTNYVSVRVYDNAGNSATLLDPFYVKKDVTNPGITDNQTGDDTWKNTSGTSYNIDFTDTGNSLLSYAQYVVYSNTNLTGSTLKDWTNIASSINANDYTNNWQVDWTALQQGTNYVSVRVYDNAGNSAILVDPFYIKRDTNNPGIADVQSGDDTFKTAGGTNYNINFSDTGGSLLSYAQYTVWTNTEQTGVLRVDWTNIASSINSNDYTQDWTVDFASLAQGTNYVSVKVYDNVGNSATLNDVFYVKRDTSKPGIVDTQTGDDTWKNSSGTSYNVDFNDNQSLLSYVQYTVFSNTALTGSTLKDWTNIASSINASEYTDNWQVDWASGQQGTNYVSVRAYDNMNNSDTLADVFYVKKDTNNPTITDNQTGDDTWKNSSGTTYNIDFSDTGGSLLSYVQYTVYSNTGLTGSTLKDWTNIASSINASDWTDNWQVDWTSLQQGTNWVSVRVYDNSGNWATLVDPFYIKKDINVPYVTDNQTGDDTYRNSSGTSYNVDFYDTTGAENSLLSYVQYTVYSSSNMTGSTLKAWTNIASSINASEWTSNWQIDFSSLQEGTSYVSVRVFDIVGNGATLVDPFYVKKDATLPQVTDNQLGDDTWKKTSGTTYDINFSDAGTSLLAYAQYTIYSSPGQTGSTLKDWTNIATSINASDYTDNWQVDWTSLQEGTNYVSVRVYDNAGNFANLNDVFYVKKDTNNPTITDNQTGDDTWKNLSATTYNIDFSDTLSLINNVQYTVYSNTNLTGSTLIDWTNIASSINASDYTQDWAVDFALLQQGTNYVSARVYDNSGNWATLLDVFYVKKDTSGPTITDNQTGDDTFKTTGGTVYNIDFTDNLSLLSYTQYTIYTSSGLTGTQLKTWTTFASSINASDYTNNWQVDFGVCQQGTNYISVKGYDISGNVSQTNDIFYVKKDTNNPTITDNQTGDDTWKNSSGTAYNVDFSDGTSLIDTIQYAVYSNTNWTGTTLIDWTNIATGVNASSYTDNWQVNFASLQEGTNYVSVKLSDYAGLSNTLADTFYVKKDTNNPGIADNQTGDDTVRSVPGTTYNVDFSDTGNSLLSYAQYTVYSGTNFTGTTLKNWTNIASSINASDYTIDWSVDFGSLNAGATNYVSVRTFDNAGNSATLIDPFYIIKAADLPLVTDNQTGDDTWRTSNTGTYNVDFSSTSGFNLDYFQTRIMTSASQGGSTLQDWITVASGIGAIDYTNNWSILASTWSSCNEGTNYVSTRVYDTDTPVNSTTVNDVFYVKKDTSNPGITDNQTGDDVWRTETPGTTTYNVDFSDTTSLLSYAQYTVYSNTNFTGSTLKDWTNIATSINASNYTIDWQIDFASLQQGTNYVSVRVYDNAGLSATLADVFYAKKDTDNPGITDNQTGDDTWRSTSGTTYNIDFSDPGVSLLSYAQYTVYSNTNLTGTTLKDWTNIATSINASDYTDNWQVDWTSLQQGTNWVSVRVYDNAGNWATLLDPFYIKKDTQGPVVTDNQTGDDIWKDTAGTTYNIDFSDSLSLLNNVQYAVYSDTGLTGSTLKDWTNIASGIGASDWTTNWQVDWASLQEGTNWVSVKAFDYQNNSSTLVDSFYIKKDTQGPTITDNQIGDDTWRKSPNTVYNIDFSDTNSLISYIQWTAYTNTEFTGLTLKDWTNIATNVNASSYTIDWQVDFAALQEGTSYISVRAYDNLNHCTTLIDPFYVKKDVGSPQISDDQLGSDIWINSSGTTYNINFSDIGNSFLSYAQYAVYSDTGQTGSTLKDWTNIASSINASSYTNDWQVDFVSLQEGTNYVSVKIFDNAGNSATLIDVFYVKKDVTIPSVTDNQTGDDTWKKIAGTSYDIDFYDNQGPADRSKLSYVQYAVYSDTGFTGSTLKDWTNIASSINDNSYTTNWQIDFASGQEGTNYVSARVYDNAGNSVTLADSFYVKKDTQGPTITDSETGDDTWKNVSGTAYNIDWTDTKSLLDYVQYAIYSSINQTGSTLKDWTNIASGIGASDYTTNWQIDFAASTEGFNYVSVRGYDNLGNVSTLTDAFYLKKDTGLPSGICSPQSYSNQLTFNVPFSASDAVSDISQVKLYYTTSSGSPYAWTNYGSFITSPVSWTAGGPGSYGFRIVAFDNAGNTDETDPPAPATSVEGTTIIDTTSPSITDNQSGDDNWKNSSGMSYNIDFSDTGGSLLSYAQYTIYSDTGLTGSTLKDWTNIATSINSATYQDNWQVDFASLQTGTNYVSVRGFDNSGNSATLVDSFYVKKDTSVSGITDNQTGDDTWRSTSGTSYNIDFSDTGGSLLSYVQYAIYSNTNLTGSTLKDWTNIAISINANDYTDNWQVDWASLQTGTNYVSVRVYDNAGNSATLIDP